MSRLGEIVEYKRHEIEPWLAHSEDWEKRALQHRNFRGFRVALDLAPFGIVAEVKKASPSAGVIVENFDPLAVAMRYEDAGAHCISVLTDEHFFQGHLDYLALIHRNLSLPILRKDFTLHEVQIYQAVLAGADAILLIVAALTDKELSSLLGVANNLRIDVLVEVHNEAEVERALTAGATFIGINNRDLGTFTTDLTTTERLLPLIPDECTVVSESGLKTVDAVRRVADAGADAALVGEALMRSPDPKRLIREILEATRR
jgi:indole-3-glycerol phosphate synthase